MPQPKKTNSFSKSQPLVSIIIPCYNAESYIEKAISSAVKQTWGNKEIIVVDDGSTDKSWEIISRIKSTVLQKYKIDHAGACAARNYGIRKANGEYLQFLDADDLISPRKIEIQLVSLKNSDSIISCSWCRFAGSTERAIYVEDKLWQDQKPVDWLVASWGGGLMMPPHAWLVPKKLADRAGPWDEFLLGNQDGEYLARVILNSHLVQFCNSTEAVAYYRATPDSLSQYKDALHLSSRLKSLELCANHLLSIENTERTRQSVASRFLDFAFYSYLHDNLSSEKAEILAQKYGGSNLVLKSGPMFNLLRLFFGWKTAKRIQYFIRKVLT